MLKRRLCEAEFEWKLECPGPLLIADGRYRDIIKRPPYKDSWTKPNGFPDALFISRSTEADIIKAETQIKGGSPKLPFYVPGTSLRGPFRAQAERIIRTLRDADDQAPVTACDPFEQGANNTFLSCSKRLEKEKGILYKEACPACKIFGYAGLASRIIFTDAKIEGLNGPYHSVYRDMIGIDRFTGGVFQGGEQGGGANMRFHVLENTTFTTTVTLANFELWHLGLLAYVFRDFHDGLVPIGFGKTKGFGLVTGELTKITLSYPKANTSRSCIDHLGSLISDSGEKTRYALHDCQPPSFDLPSPDDDPLSLYHRYILTEEDAIRGLWSATAPTFNAYIASLTPPVEMPPAAAIEGEDS
jgi:CRISPR-associated RAMP protein (TIGR02581 family)